MITLALASLVALAPPVTVAATSPSAPCAGVVDRTATCAAPDDAAPVVASDARRDVPLERAHEAQWDVATMPAQLGLASAALAFGGASALVLAFGTDASNGDEAVAQQIAAYTGAGLLTWSALAGAGALALAAFDPAAGALRVPFGEGE